MIDGRRAAKKQAILLMKPGAGWPSCREVLHLGRPDWSNPRRAGFYLHLFQPSVGLQGQSPYQLSLTCPPLSSAAPKRSGLSPSAIRQAPSPPPQHSSVPAAVGACPSREPPDRLPLFLPHETAWGACPVRSLCSGGFAETLPFCCQESGRGVGRDRAKWADLTLLHVGEEPSLKLCNVRSHGGQCCCCSVSGVNCLASLRGRVPRSCPSAIISAAGAF